MRYHLILPFLVLSLVVMAGCGSSLRTWPVEGTIKLDGKPLAEADVRFTPVENQGRDAAFAITDEQGHYQLQTTRGKAEGGALPGEYKVTVIKSVLKPNGQKILNPETGKIEPDVDAVNILPPIYQEPDKTPLTVTVDKKSQTFDFDLKTK